jgi:hypothetical protein
VEPVHGKRRTTQRAGSGLLGKEEAMEAREDANERAVRRDDAITARLGAAALPLGVVLIAVFEVFHPQREDPMANPAVFLEYANSDSWTTVHLGQYFGFLLILGGLVALYYSVSARQGVGAGLAPFGLAAAVTTAASYTVLQAVDGITLKRAVDAWASAPADQQTAAFAAAEAVRWTEMGMNALSNFLTGLTLLLIGVAIALGGAYPRWTGWMAAASGLAFAYNGLVEVAYEGFVPSIAKPVGILLLAVWAFIMAALMWRKGGRRSVARPGSTPAGTVRRSANPR